MSTSTGPMPTKCRIMSNTKHVLCLVVVIGMGLAKGGGVFAAQPSGEVEDTPSESSKQPVVDELRARVREPRANVVPPEKNQIETRVDSVVGFN